MKEHSISSAPLSLRHRLQAETRDIHEALHVHPLLAPLGSDAMTRDQYGDILSAFYSFYAAHEPLYKNIENRFSAEANPLALIEADLKILNRPVPESQAPSTQADLSDYLGYLYVKQGSTLGGQLIAKAIENSLHLERGTRQHFFYGAGPQTGPNWKKFELYLEQQSAYADPDRVVTHARHCFTQLEQHLTEHVCG